MIRRDFLGRRIRVVEAKNPSLTGLSGECVDETTHTLRVRTDRGEKTVLKTHATLEVGDVQVEGHIITGSPQNRTKRKVTKWQRTKIK